MSYDYTDAQVSQLIVSTHFPVELDDGAMPPNLTLVCARCKRPWPCPTITEYRAAVALNQSREPAVSPRRGP